MATTSNVQPKADQPRVTTGELKRGSQPANLQYRVAGVKNIARTPNRAGRTLGRS